MIITGAKLDDDACWSDDSDGVEAAESKKWRMSLIDFGFARPLHPDEVDPERNFVDATKPEPDDGFFGRSTVDDVRDDSIHKIAGDPLNNSLSNSISHNLVRNLSAVGNRNYAAPEVTSKLKKFKDILNTSGGKLFKNRKKAPLAECVSDYGMIADAFSIGTTIRHMVTGVPPSISVEDFLAMKNNPVRLIGKQMKKVFPAKKNEKAKRKKRYRSNGELPKPAIRLVLGLTHWNQMKRTTVREARAYEWVASSISAKEEHDKAADHGQGLKYLKCAYD
jgi:serine/threonine protein kinase